MIATSKSQVKKNFIRPSKSPAAVGPYNHAVQVGDLLFSSGQIPLDPATGKLVEGDIRTQTQQVLENIRTILEDQGLSFSSVVKSTVFLTSLADFAAMNEVYSKFFTTDFPARSTVQVAALPRGASVEIEVIAHY
ncbi:MAG: RidA family protein [Opitutaceae bacterium]|nr:RidA family protein [Verrucomicrobiales bacterium]